MAAHSGGTDFLSVIKPILSNNLNKNDTINIIKTILRSENEFFEHDASYDQFYMAFSVLAADCISGQCNLVCQTQVTQMIEASSILIKFILNRLSKSAVNEVKFLLPPLKSLCEGKSQTNSFDTAVVSSLLKSSKFPEHTKSNVTGGNNSDKDSPKSEMKRSRSDLSTVILQQLTTPLGANTANCWAPLSEELTNCTLMFSNSNISCLESLNAGDIILEVCSSLPILSRYRLKYEESALNGKPLYLPLTPSEATQMKNTFTQMSADILILAQALSLPVLEPLTPTKISQLSQCAMSALYCGVLASISSSVLSMTSSSASLKNAQASGVQQTAKEQSTDESEDHARIIVDKALEIFSTIGELFRNSARSHIYQNHLCFGAWLLITGIQGAMGASGSSSSKQQQNDDKGKSPGREQAPSSARVNLFKVQQGFGVLNSAIASHSLILLTELIEDLKIETRSGEDYPSHQNNGSYADAACFDILEHYTSLQRVVRVLSSTTIQQLLTFLATVSYRKACNLKRSNAKDRTECDPISYSDSTTYFNDTLSCSDDSETEEEDSESYLGLWFKETLSPEANDDPTENIAQEKINETPKSNLVPAKDEPHEYLDLSAQIFSFLDQSLGTNHQYLTKYVKSGLSEQQMVLLANILKDLDRDAARGEPENSVCPQWQTAMIKFSGALGRYLHNLVSASLLNESLQSSLLLHLGVSPWTQDSNLWPLQVYSRTLSVLVQILLLKPTQEKEAACLSVWHRLVNTLVEGVCSTNPSSTDEYEDLNVEHAQLLLFLFHSLNLMQKKSILLLTAGGVIRCAEVCRTVSPDKPLKDNQLMLLSRLLLFLEYLMKHLYNAPTNLLEQVRWNLFSVITLDANQKVSDLINNKTKLMSFCRQDIEEKLKKYSSEYASGIRPKFYSLAAVDTKIQQEFKLDGLAWNFILCTPDKLKYPLLVDALIDILSVTDICMSKAPIHTLCSVQYCFSLCWKLLLGMPPSTPHVEALMQEKHPNLHSLLWSIRCLHPVTSSHYLIVNSLVKQGMYTQYAESLWTKVTEHVSDIRYSLKNSILSLESFNKSFNIQNPRISKIILFDAMISHMHALAWAEKEGIKPPKLTSSNNGSGNSPSPSSSTTSVPLSDQNNSSTSSSSSDSENQDHNDKIPKDELTKELLIQLLDSVEMLRDCTFKTMSQSLSGPIPVNLLQNLISISGCKNVHCAEIAVKFLSLINRQDKDVIIGEWKKNLSILGEESFVSSNFPVELHTLTVIDGHVSEISKSPNYSVFLSLKHALKSAIYLIYYLLPAGKSDPNITERLKTKILVPMLFDIRTEYMYEIAQKCLELLMDVDSQSDAYQLLCYTNLLKYSYAVLIEFTEESRRGEVHLDESILSTVLKNLEFILDKNMGMKAMHEFFFVTKSGSLVELLLSFANTQLSQNYSTKMLQFFEKLFQCAEKPESKFPMEELAQCISELSKVDIGRLKVWLSHILLGPGNINQQSASSSNAQTPTNMATVSQIPSLSEQVVAAGSELIEADPMEVDEECNSIQQQQLQQPPVAQSISTAWQGANSFLTNRSDTPPNEECIEENGRLLQNITKYLVAEGKISPTISSALFQALIQLGQNLVCPSQEALDFTDLLLVMVTLADAGHGKGHSLLFPAAIQWFDTSKYHVLDKPVKQNSKSQENVIALLRYMSDLLHGLGFKGSRVLTRELGVEEEMQPDFEDLFDEFGNFDDEDSAVEDSDEDSLGNKLCTFSQTQKEFMNQHWYHCHTCNMVNTVGVCSVCARVCHKNHDVSYAKYGNFFCDCGAKEDGSCQALSRRINSTHQDPSSSAQTDVENLSMRKRAMTPPSQTSNSTTAARFETLEIACYMTKTIETSKEQLNNQEQWTIVLRCILEFFELLMPSIKENCALYSTVGAQLRAQKALDLLHQPEKTFQISDQLMVPTLGSQEGAFENVRMNYGGEQGQTIKQLLSSGLVRRVALCCLSSPHGKRQHLAVSHEKGKVTILQLSALLKQADAAKRKLTLHQLSSAPIPCTVLSLTANPANEDCLAVCGLKECHILTFSTSGSANEHIVLTPQLETGNFIKKAIWLPGSQTKLALVTADFVKIYELAEDTYSPQYYFLVAIGKIRDCTFTYQEGIYYMILIASSGYIYYQQLDEESLAKHGDFYVTNTLELNHPHIKDISGQVGGGGVSIYYSHSLQLLFFSYSLGRSFMAPLVDINKGVKCIMPLQTGPPNSKNSSKGPPQPLCQWTEIHGHAGLIFAMMQTSNNPVIFMLKPDGIVMQEIKAQSSKSKIMDMVAIRHTVSGIEKTTLILLCEDGSLRIFTAHQDNTNFWLSSEVQPIGNQMYSTSFKFSKKNKAKGVTGKSHISQNTQKSNLSSSSQFPIDFFEHCTTMPDVEFGGNDLLQIYNTQKLKTRLFSTGMFVASTKPNGFTLEVINNDANLVIVGIRVLIGTQDPLRAPQSVTVLNRVINTPLLRGRARWFDIPLTREESLQSDKKLSVIFGKSQDPENICMLDGIELYGKTKDVFGWPEETEENQVPGTASGQQNSTGNNQNGNSNDGNTQTITLLDRMTTQMLEVLDCGLGLLGGTNVESSLKQKAMKIATELMIMPTPNPVQTNTHFVLASLHGNRNSYYAYKDKEILNEVQFELKRLDEIEDQKTIDPEAFYRLVLLTRSIAVSRPQALTKICLENDFTILPLLLKLTKKLYSITPRIDEPSTVVTYGLNHTEAIIHCLVEILYAFALSDPTQVETMTKYFVELLLEPSKIISHSAKDAMILLMNPRVKRRKVVFVSPPVCSTPTPQTTPAGIPSTSTATNAVSLQTPPSENDSVEIDAAIGLPIEAADGAVNQQQALASLEALLGGGFPQLLDLQQDDDEAIMDIAIALSLQQNDGDIQSFQQGLATLHGIRNNSNPQMAAVGGSVGTVSSPGGSDDDEGGSNAATDGSTGHRNRASPAEQASGSGSGGSESGGSCVESIGGTSGRSSTYGEAVRNEIIQVPTENLSQEIPTTEEPDESSENENAIKLHNLRCSILNKIVENFKLLDNCNGQQSIPFLQVILMLTTDLDGNLEIDQQILNKLLTALVEKLDMNPASQAQQMLHRQPKTEVQLAILCLFGVLMGKTKSSSKQAGTTSPPHQFKDNASFVAGTTANVLMKSNAIPYCLVIMETFLTYWKNQATSGSSDQSSGVLVGGSSSTVPIPTGSASSINNVLKASNYGPKPDISSLIPNNYIKNYSDVFDAYSCLLTEVAVRLPYQILKLSSGQPSAYDWYHKFCESMTFTLCEYMMLNLAPLLRRQVRKLLMYICGNKEKFRLFRDGHSLDVHIYAIKKACDLSSFKQIGTYNHPLLSYDALVDLTEHLRMCQEISQVRTGNWQKFCVVHEEVISSLIQICCYQLDDGVSPIILQLLQAALCNTNTNKSDTKSTSCIKARQDRDKSEEAESAGESAKFDLAHCSTFVHQIFRFVPDQLFTKFINIFLLETNITSIRWQTHALIYAIYENSNDKQKERLLKILWDMWPMLPAYGRRTAQFVDILGYLTLSTKSIVEKLPEYTEKAVSILQQQNELLSKHPNAPIYTALGQVLELDGFFLESEPCLVCNNPELPMTNIKLPTIKTDSKFTTTTMIVKLVQSHTISKIILRIADLKRTKMVRTINIYYNNRTVQGVVELKNRPSMWHKARVVSLQNGQTEVKIDFPLPITACNLMVEYADFYETVTGSSENLQCPRCSAAVPSYPGVCANCGENVFQCHKCRAINYDEKDPFLCHSCGFCKYAKFDFSIYGRPCCAVDPIESAEDRVKTVQTIHSSLEKADRIYRQLQANKQILELLIQKVADHKVDRIDDSFGTVVSSSQVNKVIQLLAQKYCVESKTSFEELSKVAQKVKACRRELVAYDRSQMDTSISSLTESTSSEIVTKNRCYGCALASTEQCLTLLRAMASNLECRKGLCGQALVEELAQNNLRRGTPQIQDEVRNLLCLLTRDLPNACRSLLTLIHNRVKMALNGIVPLANLDITVRHEMLLLEALIAQDDFCWEMKLKVVFELFLMACRDTRGPVVAVIQPCLRIIQSLICPPVPISKAHKELLMQELTTITSLDGITVDFRKWLDGDENHTFASWKARMPPNIKPDASGAKPKKQEEKPPPPQTGGKGQRMFGQVLEHKRMQLRRAYLSEKYGKRWRNMFRQKSVPNPPLELTTSWLQPVLFNTNSRFSRQLACNMISSLSRTHERKREILNLLTDFLKYVGEAGEASAEFLTLYRSLAIESPWRQYLALRGVLFMIADLLSAEIDKIHLEETTLSSDLAQGYALRQFVELLSMFLENAAIRQAYKGRLLGPVLQGYLSLRKLVVQRTRLIDDAQEKLLEMLEEMTTGTEEETRAFMSILIETVEKTPINDIKTPVFIFERLYSIIHPEENDDGEFFLTLEKDPQQEDFLQGRMLGNPYSSSEAGLGPLMRDVKNKICTDCELIALLEDDNGMELLVNNKIISLDLPVKEVYKRVWLAEGGERDTMRVVYRMRGLLGDATEEFVETLNNKSQEEIDTETLYCMANVLADCDGLKVMLERISSLQTISRNRELIQVLLKLFLISVKVRRCLFVLCQPELGAINTLLRVLQMCLQSENDPQQNSITEQLLEIMETILSKAASDTLDSFLQFSLTFGGPEYVTALISCTNCTNVRNNPGSVLRHLIRVLAALVYGNEVKMALLCEHFKGTLDFDKFDTEHTPEDEFKMELFCVLTNQIEHNSIGGTLKDYIIGLGIVDKAIHYITKYAPCVKPTLLRTDSDELKEFISRPSLKYILRFLTGLANKHEATQLAVSKDIIPIIHRLEQVSSDEHVGSLAENLLESLCTDEATAKRVQEVRDFTRAEKKRLAMATREKQLDALGMRTNEKGQVTAKGSILQKIEKLRDETGLTCFICREGYACQPNKVLGIYTFTKRTNVEDFELKPRKSLGYTTVTHFNVVHIDCHTSAIRLSRGRDEWERASLQNANTRCNGLLPLWGPDVSESAFSTCMSRHSNYMQESTQRCDISFGSSIHDLKLLLNRFAWEKSFHDDAGGGGPQSNISLTPYLLFYSLYMLLSARTAVREEKALSTFLSFPPSEKWLESAYDVDGPLYQITLSLALHSPSLWMKNKLIHLKRLITIAQARDCSPNVLCKALLSANDRQQKEYNVYRPYLMLWGLVDLFYAKLFRNVTTPKEEDWPVTLFDYIRRNDEAMLKTTENILTTFTEEYQPCASFGEYCDVAGLLNDIENPEQFVNEILLALPSTSTA